MYWLRQQHNSLEQRLNNGASATSYDTDIDDEIGDMIYKSGETAKARAVAAAANITPLPSDSKATTKVVSMINKRRREYTRSEYAQLKQDVTTNMVRNGGVCVSHRAKMKTCRHEGCTTNAKK